jgi:cytochrome c
MPVRYSWSVFGWVAVLAGVGANPAIAQEARAGATTAKAPTAFQSCVACHSDKPGVARLGPSLAGIFGKPAAQAKGFRYSPALSAAKLRWDRRTLDAFIADPRAVIPGTRMIYPGLKDAAKRQVIVDYLERLK